MPRIKNEDLERAEYILGKDQKEAIRQVAGRIRKSDSAVLRQIIDKYFRGKTLEEVEAKLGY